MGHAKPKLGENKNCEVCGVEFYVSPARLRTNKHHTCSKKCSGQLATKLKSQKIKVPCVICGTEIAYKQSHFKEIASPCCSYKCSWAMRRIRNQGEGNTKSLKLSDEDRIFWERAKNLRLRAEAKKIDYNLDYLFLKEMFYKQEGSCFYSKIPMNLKSKGLEDRDLSFSVDRIDSDKGYTKDNVVLCLTIINRFKGDSQLTFFNEVCKALGLTALEKNIKIKKLNELAITPKYQSSGASGFDLHSTESIIIMPKETAIIGTGLAFQLPENTELQIRPRSGISAKTKVRVANSPGTIDRDYSGEVKIILDNNGDLPYTVNIGDRIAQGVIVPVYKVIIEEIEELEQTERGSGGLGSTGIK